MSFMYNYLVSYASQTRKPVTGGILGLLAMAAPTERVIERRNPTLCLKRPKYARLDRQYRGVRLRFSFLFSLSHGAALPPMRGVPWAIQDARAAGACAPEGFRPAERLTFQNIGTLANNLSAVHEPGGGGRLMTVANADFSKPYSARQAKAFVRPRTGRRLAAA